MLAVASHVVEGHVSRGFEACATRSSRTSLNARELGGACCAYCRGEKVVDLWGGVRNKVTGEPWERDTMVVVHSATKGLAAMTLAIAHSRGWLDYDERVATYWPEFAQHGKEKITVRQLLAHQAGLFAFDEPVDRSVVADLDRLAAVMARHKPAWEPGTRQAYHALTLGFYEGELMRRVDPRHRTLGQFFYDEIAAPLGEDVYIRLPEEIPNSRLAILAAPGRVEMLFGFPLRLTLEGMNPRSNISSRAHRESGRVGVPRRGTVYARNLEVPSGGGVGTARGIAHAYGVFATGGASWGSGRRRWICWPRRRSRRARVLRRVHEGRGAVLTWLHEALRGFRFGGARSFGSPGAGGAMGFADPEAGVGYAYVTSQMGTALPATRGTWRSVRHSTPRSAAASASAVAARTDRIMTQLKVFVAIGRRVVCRRCRDRIGQQRTAFLVAPEANGVSRRPSRRRWGRRMKRSTMTAIRSFLDGYLDAWNAHDPAAVAGYMADGAIDEDVALGRVLHGPSEIAAFVEEATRASSDFRFEEVSLFTAGAASRTNGHARTTLGAARRSRDRPLVPRSGGVGWQARYERCIVENRDYYNLAEMLTQLGIPPTAPPQPA